MRNNKLMSILVAFAVMFGVVGAASTPAVASGFVPIVAPAPAAKAALPICASAAICFADLPDGVSNEGLPATVARNTCKTLIYVDQASRVDNESNYRWYVYTGPNCTGTRGIIYPHTDGRMAFPFDNSINCAVRTSSTTIAPESFRKTGNAVDWALAG